MNWKIALVVAAIVLALLPLVGVEFLGAAACYFLAVLALGLAFFVPPHA